MSSGGIFDSMERASWRQWEDGFSGTEFVNPLPIPVYSRSNHAAVDIARPFIVRGFLNGSSSVLDTWTENFFAQSPRGDIMVDYFTDARKFNTVPDAVAPLRDIMRNISKGGNEKFGTEMLFRQYPELLNDLPLDWFNRRFGSYFSPAKVGLMLTVPIFYARGQGERTTRTDTHCEPIGNAMLMLTGKKRWLLFPPSQSTLLRPQVSPDGRGYIYATRDPADSAIRALKRYDLVVEAGDLLWVPCWYWHRVEYIEGIAALSVSLFHFRPLDFIRSNPGFAVALLPNLIKELVGWKTQ